MSGEFNIKDAIDLEKLKSKPKLAKEKIIKIETLFSENEQINLNTRELALFLNGVMLTEHKDNGIYRIYTDEKFIGLGKIQKNSLKRDIIIDF